MEQDKNKQTQSRRDFCKNTALAAGGMLALPLDVTASANVLGSDTIKIALVGCGGRGTGAALQALSTKENVQLVAMADAFRDRLDSCYDILSKKFGGTEKIALKEEDKHVGFEAYKAAIDKADVVLLTTTPGFRPIHFEYAVNKDKHIFMEKPLATDAPGIRKVLAAAEIAKQKKLNVVVGLQRHYQKNYLACLEKVREGKMGQIVSGQVYWNSGGVWVKERQAAQTEMEYQMRNWYYFNWLCGDHIVEQHIHNIDVANWFIGEFPIHAQGMGGREVRTDKKYGEIFDHHFVEFTYPSGAVISSQCRHQKGCITNVSECLMGTKGKIYLDSQNKGIISGYDGSTIYEHQGAEDPNPYQTEHDELFASIKAGGVINDAEHAAKTTMTAILGRMATYSGQLITFEDALNKGRNLMPSEFSWDTQPKVLPDAEGNYRIPVPGVTQVLES
ncbi:Gfo/Idh/MocA family protein [Poritiphilus flavus]|uniref:Gfo/Idh/MocA family oxidoreductase n=1 Tax=Poritiphilus flavus TaxID=2697053 RepID=A0A6L9ED15_9FLAO|nr:Gfo/Idh/MocA family oxidoreductase [Poritiphilus flavus]NAS12521.1 Gfo/Idh/MocA family oxidoreductase [Poritiphilus flavus]